MKKPGGGDEQEEGHRRRQAGRGGGGTGALYPIFKDVKNTVGNSQLAAVHLQSPITRHPRPRRQQGGGSGRKSSTTSNGGNAPGAAAKTTATSGFSKWAKKRSMRVSLPSGGGGAAPAKRAYQHSSSSAAVQHPPQGEETAHSSSSTDKNLLMESLTQSRKSVFYHERPSAAGIPTDALSIHRTVSQPLAFDDADAMFMPLSQYTAAEEEFVSCFTAGPMDVHRHFDFAPLPDSLSPDAWHVPYLLKTVERPQVPSTGFMSISGEVLKVLLCEMSAEQFKSRFILVDCRYPYEYEGGHIKHAINLYEPKRLESLFYPTDESQFADVNDRIPIFYCEFSQKRGPQMAKQLRKCDRGQCAERWPHVDYKEVYLLDQGYRKFFCDFKELCEPQHYIPMKHASYATQLKKYDQHKKRAERKLLKLSMVEPMLPQSQEPERRVHWGATPSRPPLSPAAARLPPMPPLLFDHPHLDDHLPEQDDGAEDERHRGPEEQTPTGEEQ